MKPQDIVLIKFPFTDLSTYKLRPALVLNCFDPYDDLLVCAISSQKKNYSIEFTQKDLLAGSIPVNSYILYQKLITINKSIVQDYYATLNNETFQVVTTKLKSLF